ncbi:MAG: sialate O-acetylesterase [Chitinivibrionales bacterium]|nr:sialate O-acetylesterase [Chitinivibrionales bacterium]
MKLSFKLSTFVGLLSATLIFGQSVSFTDKPVDMRFYGHDAQDSGVVTISGTVTTAGVDAISVTIYKNNISYKTVSQNLTYSGGSALFNLAPKIYADTVNYKFEIKAGTTVVATADKVLCGDVFIMSGQSNVCVGEQNLPAYTTPWTRTYNYGSWGNPNQTAYNLAKHVILQAHHPYFEINNGVPGAWLSMFSPPDTVMPGTYTTIWGPLKQSGLNKSVTAVIWHQGEANSLDSIDASKTYDSLFGLLYNGWLRDFPTIQRVYAMQIHTSSGGGMQSVTRETQRKLHTLFSKVETVPTIGVVGPQPPHFSTDGYIEIGDWVFALMQRDIYGSTDTINLDPPNIVAAKFDNGAHTSITLTFCTPVILPADTTVNGVLMSVKDYFYLGGDEVGKIVSSASVDTVRKTLTLILKAPATDNRISYTSTLYPIGGPWLFSPRGIAALAFRLFPISLDTTVTTSAVPAAGKSVLKSALTFNMNNGVLSVSVGFTTPYRLDIVKSNGVVAIQLNGERGTTFQINKNRLPAGLYLLRAIDAAGNKAARLVTWY